MRQYEVLRSIHKVGHPISGVVLGPVTGLYAKYCQEGSIELQTDSAFKCIIPYDYMLSEQELADGFLQEPVRQELIPTAGSRIDAVVRNYVDGILYLSTSPEALDEQRIASYRSFYEVIDRLEPDTIIEGTVEAVRHFGIFVNLSLPFPGLIDIGYSGLAGGRRLPYDAAEWPKEGDPIRCLITSFRFDAQQIDLEWMPYENC